MAEGPFDGPPPAEFMEQGRVGAPLDVEVPLGGFRRGKFSNVGFGRFGAKLGATDRVKGRRQGRGSVAAGAVAAVDGRCGSRGYFCLPAYW